MQVIPAKTIAGAYISVHFTAGPLACKQKPTNWASEAEGLDEHLDDGLRAARRQKTMAMGKGSWADGIGPGAPAAP
jgi:hypothetical protein